MDFSTQDIKQAAQMAQKLKGKSEEDAISQMVQMIKSGQGGMTPQKVEQMVSMIMPMVEDNQKKKLQKLLQELKD